MSDICMHEFCPCSICTSESAIREDLVQCYHCPKMKEWVPKTKEELEKQLKEINAIANELLFSKFVNMKSIDVVKAKEKIATIEELSK